MIAFTVRARRITLVAKDIAGVDSAEIHPNRCSRRVKAQSDVRQSRAGRSRPTLPLSVKGRFVGDTTVSGHAGMLWEYTRAGGLHDRGRPLRFMARHRLGILATICPNATPQ